MTFASRNTLTLALGHGARAASRLRGSGGSAFPGLVMEKADPHFMARALAPLPYGVVLVSGTNGKTTTTRMVVELLPEGIHQPHRLKLHSWRSGRPAGCHAVKWPP